MSFYFKEVRLKELSKQVFLCSTFAPKHCTHFLHSKMVLYLSSIVSVTLTDNLTSKTASMVYDVVVCPRFY